MRTLLMKTALLGLMVCAAGQLQAEVITLYQDDFTSATDANIYNRVPGGTLGDAGEEWFARGNRMQTMQATASTGVAEYFQHPDDPSIAPEKANTLPSNASLAFTPEAGKMYTLSADLNNMFTGNFESVWLGFRGNQNVSSTFSDVFAASRIYRRNPQDDFVVQAKTPDGVNILGQSASGTLQLVLDTTGADWGLTTTWDSTEVGSYTYSGDNPAITHVGFGFSDGSGGVAPSTLGSTVDNFSLTVVPEPATIGMLGLGAVGVLFLRRGMM